MKWKILVALDLIFSTIAVISALVLGNSLVAGRVPALHHNATWLSKLVLKGMIVPDNVAKWALGSLPAKTTLLIFTICIAGEALLVRFSPLVERLAAFMAAQRFEVDFDFASAQIRRSRDILSPLRRKMFLGVIARLLGHALLAFLIGAGAGSVAWGVAALINANTGGLLQTVIIVLAIGLLLIINDMLGDILKEATSDDDSVEMLRERFTQAGT